MITTTSTTSRREAMTQMTLFEHQETDLSRCAAVDSLDFDSEDDGDYSLFVPSVSLKHWDQGGEPLLAKSFFFLCVIQPHFRFSVSDQVCNLGISWGFWSLIGYADDQPFLLMEPPDPPPTCVGDVLRVL